MLLISKIPWHVLQWGKTELARHREQSGGEWEKTMTGVFSLFELFVAIEAGA